MKNLLPLLLLPLFARGQAPAPSVTPEWDISQTIGALSAQAARLKPILDQLTPQEWVQKGAPQAYVAQWQGAEKELGYLTASAQAFENDPEQLSRGLDVYFRWQSLREGLNSLVEGVRRYQNPAVGDLLVGVLAENAANRDRLRSYLTDLAAQKEQEFAVVDKEAQRCRGDLVRQPAQRRAPARKAAPKPQTPKP
jgi:hypothetical protein